MPTDWENTTIQEGIEGRAVKVYFNLILFWLREAKKTVLFGSIDPNVGGRGRVDPNTYKSLFLWHI